MSSNLRSITVHTNQGLPNPFFLDEPLTKGTPEADGNAVAKEDHKRDSIEEVTDALREKWISEIRKLTGMEDSPFPNYNQRFLGIPWNWLPSDNLLDFLPSDMFRPSVNNSLYLTLAAKQQKNMIVIETHFHEAQGPGTISEATKIFSAEQITKIINGLKKNSHKLTRRLVVEAMDLKRAVNKLEERLDKLEGKTGK